MAVVLTEIIAYLYLQVLWLFDLFVSHPVCVFTCFVWPCLVCLLVRYLVSWVMFVLCQFVLVWAQNLAYWSLRGPLNVRLYETTLKEVACVWGRVGKSRDGPRSWFTVCAPCATPSPWNFWEALFGHHHLGQIKHNQEELILRNDPWEPRRCAFLWAMGAQGEEKPVWRGSYAPLRFRSSDFCWWK